MFYVKTALPAAGRNGEYQGCTTTNAAFTQQKDAENHALHGGRNGNSRVWVVYPNGKVKKVITVGSGPSNNLKTTKKLAACEPQELEEYTFSEPQFCY